MIEILLLQLVVQHPMEKSHLMVNLLDFNRLGTDNMSIKS